jgi:hypothetical protein
MPNFKNVTSGSIIANGGAVTHPLRLVGPGKIAIQVTGTFTGTLDFEATVDGSTWVDLACKSSAETTATTLVKQATAAVLVLSDAYALDSVRVVATAWTSGTANVTIASVSE